MKNTTDSGTILRVEKRKSNVNKKQARAKSIIGILVLILVLGGALFAGCAKIWTDYLWYQSVGQTSVFWARFNSIATTSSISFSVVAAFLLLTMLVALKLSPGWRRHSAGHSYARVVETPQGPKQVPDARAFLDTLGDKLSPILRVTICVVALFFAFVTASRMAEHWETLRLALANVPFNVNDPQFGIDAGFYVFQLPALKIILGEISQLIVLSLALTAGVYFFAGGIRPWSKSEKVAPHVKAHISVLLALFMVLQAVNTAVRMLELNFSTRGQVNGASYADVHAQIPALIIMGVICLLIAIMLVFNIFRKGWRLPIVGVAIWAGASIVLTGIFPEVIQRFVVQPNEASLEAPYIKRNIAMTRKAFALTDVSEKTFPATNDLTEKAVDEDQDTINNVRLWDPSIAKKCYEQLQAIRPYYNFNDVDVDRYEVNGQMRQVLISPREMNIDQLASTAQTWVNQHLVYTHGYGSVMNGVSDYDTRGLPDYLVGDIPPKTMASAGTSPDLEISEPRIYYGEEENQYVVVNTGIKEFDYPQGEKNATTSYKAQTGVKVGSIFRRIAWAVRFESLQMLLSGYIEPESQILMNRNVKDRIQELAPWLDVDEDLYSAIIDGRLVWIADGYTTSSMYPYAERLSGSDVNYMRNSVKVTVDAYTGETIFYAFDETDPILKAWRTIFPDLFKSGKDMPESVRAHLRYPKELFSAQAEIYRTYHMTDPTVFYNKEDQWEIPGVQNGKEMEPFFVLLKLPGTEKEQFYMMQPYTPRNRSNMIGWMAVSSDSDSYGERTVYLFPKERVILGPEQIAARINQDPVISPQFSLWNQRGSQVIFGNMVVVPIQNSIVYVQPVFLQAEQTAIPELVSVVVAYGDKMVMNSDFKTALKEVFAGEGQDAQTGETTGATSSGGSDSSAGSTDASSAGADSDASSSSSSSSLAEKAATLYDEALKAQKAGDWATYGTKIDELGSILEQMAR